MDKTKNKIFFDNNWGFFIGSFDENIHHKHYAVQISISLDAEILVSDGKKKMKIDNCLIKSNTSHQLSCKGNHLLLLFYPTSAIGHFLNTLFDKSISNLNHKSIQIFKSSSCNFMKKEIDFKELIISIRKGLKELSNTREKRDFGDNRVKLAINYLGENYERVIPLKEIADICFLSESRFLHLFSEKTGVTYKKAQQWNKVSQSFSMLLKQSLTKTAHQFGFVDSSHYSKVFKETFGFNPSKLKRQLS